MSVFPTHLTSHRRQVQVIPVPIFIPHGNKGGCHCAKSFTKVVTQMVQFLSDSRAGDTLDAHVDLDDLKDEEEDFETAEA